MSNNPIVAQIKKDKAEVFRRLYFKRKYQAGYESDWQQIPNAKVKKWGGVSYNVDDIRLNFFSVSGNTIELKNDDNFFGDTDNIKSMFHNALSRYGTLCKIEAGYTNPDDGEEYPLGDSTAFIGYLRDDVKTGSNGIIKMDFKHVNSFLEEEFSENLALDAKQTASDVIEQMRDYTNGSGDAFFSDVIQGWSIRTTTDTYTSLVTTSVEGDSFWNTVKKLASAENKMCFVDRTGQFFFAPRNFTKSDYDNFHFSGVGDIDKSHGHNIMKLEKFDSPASKVFNYIRIKYLEADTTTSYVSKKESWTWGDSSSSFKLGVRKYEDEIDWIQNTTTAQTIADDLFQEHSVERREVTIKTKFIPHIEPFMKTTMTYITPRKEGANLWGKFLWGKRNWNAATGRYIDIDRENFLVLKVSHNFDTFESSFMMRETSAYVPGYGTSFYSRLYYNQ